MGAVGAVGSGFGSAVNVESVESIVDYTRVNSIVIDGGV